MSKRKSKKRKTTTSKVSAKANARPERPPLPEEKPVWKTAFRITIGVAALILVLLSLNTGINGDDEYQNDYSEKLIDYYGSFGADTAALNIPKGNMHYYGGFFDIVTGAVNTVLGLEVDDAGYHNVRHIFNALLGWLAMLFIALFVRQIAGYRAAIFAFLLVFLSPRFFGHSLMNPKDIPFAAGYIMAIYYLFRMLRSMPKPDWKLVLGLAGGIGLAVSTRAGGLLLLGYTGLFALTYFLASHSPKGFTEPKKWLPYVKYGLIGGLGGYLLAVLFWPFALANPISHPLEALTEFSKLGVRIRVLFEGTNVMSDTTPWYYALSWIGRTIPLIVLLGFFGSIGLYKKLTTRYGGLPINMLLFTSLFPLFYIIYKDSLLHDGWRHLMFVYPGIVILASLFWLELEKMLDKPAWGRPALYAITGILLLLPTIFILRNQNLSYVYFNELGGGMKGAYGNYETDYWGISVKDALDWMEDEGIISPDMTDTVTIASSFSYVVRKELGNRYGDIVTVRYVKYSQRYEREWDYAIFPTRYVRGPQMREGIWPSSKSIHTIDASGVPLTTILKADTKDAFVGAVAVKGRDWATAVQAFEVEAANYPDNEQAWIGLANAYINLQRPQQSLAAAQRILEIVPENLTGTYFTGLAKLNMGDAAGAEAAFRRTTEIDAGYSVGYYYWAVVQKQQGQLDAALINLEKAIKLNPRLKPAYSLAADIYQQKGDVQNANRLRQAAGQ
ncbi:MAG: tetratricopeptide repeat protein [Bacteroidetes bacterium]|nr:tetratricopeptide repeat protein [Bacteroidota bacterium]